MAKKTFSRKHFFINRHLQGRYMLTFFIPMTVMLAFLIFTIYFAVQNVVSVSTTLIKRDIENSIITHFQDTHRPAAVSGFEQSVKRYLDDFASDRQYRAAVMQSLLWVFGIGIFIVIVQISLLTIFFSHKLAGPIYRFEKMCHALIDGDYTQSIVLRKGDEMQNLAALFNEVIGTVRTRFVAVRDASTDRERHDLFSSMRI